MQKIQRLLKEIISIGNVLKCNLTHDSKLKLIKKKPSEIIQNHLLLYIVRY